MKYLVSLLILLLASTSHAQSIPNHVDWLADEANILSDAEEAQLRAASKGHDCQICVLTVPSINIEAKDYAVQALNQWNPGPASVIILVSMSPRKLYLQPGVFYKEAFNEGVATQICRKTMAPHLSQGRNFQGIQAGLEAIRLHILQPEQATTTQAPTGVKTMAWTVAAVCGGFVLLLFVAVLWSNSCYPFTTTPTAYTPAAYTSPSYVPPASSESPSALNPTSKRDIPAPPTPSKTVLPRDAAGKFLSTKSENSKSETKTAKRKRTSQGGHYDFKSKARKAAPPPSHTSGPTGSYIPYTPPSSQSSYSSYDSSSSSSYESPRTDFDFGGSSFDSGSSFSCDGGGGGGSDF